MGDTCISRSGTYTTGISALAWSRLQPEPAIIAPKFQLQRATLKPYACGSELSEFSGIAGDSHEEKCGRELLTSVKRQVEQGQADDVRKYITTTAVCVHAEDSKRFYRKDFEAHVTLYEVTQRH